MGKPHPCVETVVAGESDPGEALLEMEPYVGNGYITTL